MGEWVKIIALGVVASILYGILHDQITARICLEYFAPTTCCGRFAR
jgi:hypothetical protein